MGAPIVNAAKPRVATTTAGLRATQWNADDLPAGVQLTVHALATADGASVTGYLFRRGGERTVVCAMHPREMVVANYIVPEILKGGAAVWMMGPRTVGNDLRLEHETALLDLAAGQISCATLRVSSSAFSPERPAADRWLPSIASRRGCPVKSGSGNLRVENRPALIKPICQSSTASFSSLRIWAKGG